MSILQGSAKSAADGGFYPTTIDQSLRFNDNDSAYLSRTPSVAGNRKTWTFSAWVKRGNISTTYAQTGSYYQTVLGIYTGSGNVVSCFRINEYDQIEFMQYNGSSYTIDLITTPIYRDSSAWYHILLSVDTTQATSTDRIKLYINGEQVTAFGTATYPSQNLDCYCNNTYLHRLGADARPSTPAYADLYLAEVHFTDGTAYTADAFGEFKNGVWVAKTPSVTYGTNGFKLTFADSGALGDDLSGNTNDWTANNLAATDQMLDSPTNNFATLNVLDKYGFTNIQEGSLRAFGQSGPSGIVGTIALPLNQKTYWECYVTAGTERFFGVVDTNHIGTDLGTGTAADSAIYGHAAAGNNIWRGTTSFTVVQSSVTDPAAGTIIGIAFDGTASPPTVQFYNNGSAVGTAVSLTNGIEYTPWISSGANNYNDLSVYANFGQDSSFAGTKTPQGYTDANGIGDFYYEPPTGYLALCTSNLPEPAISPADGVSPTDYMNTVTYTGNNAGATVYQSISGVGFSPDFVWVKNRSYANNHALMDRLRSPEYWLNSNNTNAEYTSVYTADASLDADGFTTGTSDQMNRGGDAFVAWNWLAGGTGVSNTDGTITSTVSANTTSGFSIVTYGGTGTVGHGLSQTPELILCKRRDTAWAWSVSGSIGPMAYGVNKLILNDTAALAADTNEITAANSTTFTTGGSAGTSGTSQVAYCFHSVEGFSKIGTYTGNGSSDGPMVFTGHTPSFVLIKRTDSTGSWEMFDAARNPNNVIDGTLFANLSNAESIGTGSGYYPIDFLSNGFKIRGDGVSAGYNASGGTYIYMSFSSNPFKYTTAR